MNWWLVLIGSVIVLFGFVVFRGAPYVPSKRNVLDRTFRELYPLGEDDLLVDIGSGDGVVLRAAAARGARAVGYELNPLLVWLSRFLSRRYSDSVRVKLADFWHVSVPDETTIVYTFGESRDIKKMYAKVATEATRLGRPLYFMSYGFAVPDVLAAAHNASCFLYKVEPLQVKKAQV